MERKQIELSEIADKFGENLTLDSSINHQIDRDGFHFPVTDNENAKDDDEDEDEDFEFSFFGGEIASPVTAEEAFHNGQIRPIYRFSDDNAENSGESPVPKPASAEGRYCVWEKEETPSEIQSTAPEMSRKSNSTGFSRLWRKKEVTVRRSNSDGKESLAFLAGKSTVSKEAAEKTAEKRKGKKPAMTTLHGKKKGGGRSSYLPYKQEFVGIFANVNGLTRNINPY